MFLRLMAQITGHKPGRVYHRSVNYHIYNNQLDVLHESGMLERQPYNPPKLWINPEIRTWDDVVNWVTPDDFKLLDYTAHPAVVFPMAS
jgi:thymidylate synthase